MSTDENLLVLFRNGDEDAFNQLYAEYQELIKERIENFAKGKLKQEIDDIVQHFWLNLLKYAKSYDPKQPLTNWLGTSAIRSVYHYKQRCTIFQSKTKNGLAKDFFNDLVVAPEKPNTTEEFNTVFEAFHKIHPNLRIVLDKIFIQENTIQECADSIGSKPKKVYTKIDKAIKRLRETQEVKNLITVHQS